MRLREWFLRLIGSFRKSRQERDSKDELEVHLELAVEAAMRRGATREEAIRQARIELGSATSALENLREQRGLPWLDGMRLDLRHAWCGLRRQPGFLLTAAGTLAAAVTINTLVFTVAYGVLLRPLPYPDPERLVRVYEWSPADPKFPLSILNYLAARRDSRTLAGLGLYTRDDMQFMHGDRPERVPSVAVTDDFFPTLGVQPVLGRNFAASELKQQARVVILSHAFWKTRFGGDPAIVGRTVRLNRETWTIIGVLPAGFQHVGGDYRSPLQGDTVGLWWPLALDLPESGLRQWHFTNAVARLKPGVSVAAAQQDLTNVLADLGRQYPDAYAGKQARVAPLASEVVGRSSTTIRLLAVAGFIVLLVACVNVAGISVARVLARRRELAVRQALGAGTSQLMRTVLCENLVIGAIGGALGLALALAAIPVLHAVLPPDFPRAHEVQLNWIAAAFALTTAILTAIAAGILPALRQRTADPSEGLAENARLTATAYGIRSLRGALVTAEIILACVLCFGTLLLLRSAARISARDHGFDASGVLTFQLTLPYADNARVIAFETEAVRRWSALPGVRAAGLGTSIPWTGYDENTGFDIIGRAARPGESVQARFQGASPGFFEALRFRLLSGRTIAPADTATAPPVIVINATFARRYFEQDPVGRYVDVWGAKRRIVGVVADVRDRPADIGAEPAFWFPLAQQPFRTVQAAIRTDGDPAQLAAAARAALRQLDAELPMAEVRPMSAVAADALAERRFMLRLAEVFAVVAMALTAIGVYGIIAYIVQQRRKEIGIRLALGASRGSVVTLIVTNALVLAASGAIAALLLAPGAGRALSSMLFGVSAADAASLIAAPAAMVAVALLGSAIPAWAAARSEPVSTLRET